MSDILLSSEFIQALTQKVGECAKYMSTIEKNTRKANKLIESGSWNSSAENMHSKMSSLETRTKNLHDNLEANYAVFQKISKIIVELNNKIKKMQEDIDAMSNLLPDWAKRSFPISEGYKYPYIAQNGQAGSVYTRNNDNAVSCTYYTLHRLHERGLGFPFKIPGKAHGGQWYDSAADIVPKFPGKNCLIDLFNKYGQNGVPIENIVVSMNSTSSVGHVVLIDKMYMDPDTNKIMVVWSDMIGTKPFKRLYGDVNETNKPITRTIEEFQSTFYNSKNFNGAVLIGINNPNI